MSAPSTSEGADGVTPHPRRQIIALNIVVILIGAGLIGYVAIDYLRRPPDRSVANSPPGPFTGNILITFPEYGWNLSSGGQLSGTITQWRSGYQIWMSARFSESTNEIVQGPCSVVDTTFMCSNVQLAGPSGGLQHIQVAVVTNATAAQLSDSTGLPVASAADSDWTHVYKD